jgi:hypothetical protein
MRLLKGHSQHRTEQTCTSGVHSHRTDSVYSTEKELSKSMTEGVEFYDSMVEVFDRKCRSFDLK